ncbi:hypothetical protein BH23VER1_BH23VER1_02570 [soil metagenome]
MTRGLQLFVLSFQIFGAWAGEGAGDGFELEPGLEMALVASDPDVGDPIAMACDEAGRLYVVEGRGYPTDEGVGVVALLDDPDGDGRYVRVADFASGLRFPTGIMPWRGGALVTDAPDVLYLRDTDGDGVADHREVVLTGFDTDKSTQLRVNDPTLAPDGWIYFAGGLSGGEIVVPGAGAPPGRGGDVRWNPATGDIEPTDGSSQYGIAFDGAWRRFLCTNRIQNKHVVLPSRYLQRNPRLAFSDSVEITPTDRIDDLLKSENTAARLYPISDNVTTADSHAGTFSAACGVTVYRSASLPDRYHGATIACDPTANLIHADRLAPNGATFSAVRFPGEAEFLRSRDNRFRPVFLAEGPGGALFVCDMRRDVIEHPDYLPDEVRARTNFDGGRLEGRIYRVTSAGSEPPKVPPFDNLTDQLESKHAWERDTAFRLAIERGVTPELSESAPAESRVLALWMGPRDTDVIASGLGDPAPAVRETALRILAEGGAVDDSLVVKVQNLASEDDPKVRFWATLVLGYVSGDEAVDDLASIGMLQAGDRWFRAAALSGCAGREEAVWDTILGPKGLEIQGAFEFIADTAALDAGGEDFIGRIMASELPDESKVAALSYSEHRLADELELDPSGDLWTVAPEIGVRFLGNGGVAGQTKLVRMIRSLGSSTADSWAAEALRYLDPEALASLFVEGLPPYLRQAAQARLASGEAGQDHLFGLLESGAVSVSSLDPSQRAALEKRDATRAATHFEAAGGEARMAVYEALKPVAKRDGDPDVGREIFAAACASCHRLEGEGFNVGPDLYGIRNQPKDAILLHIVVPNREVLAGFTGHVVTLKNGRSAAGLIGSETATSITVRQALGIEETFLRDDIAKVEALPVSLMPDGLEAAWSEDDLAGLLAFLRGE